MSEVATKVCVECGLDKPLSAFRWNSQVVYSRNPDHAPRRKRWMTNRCGRCLDSRRRGVLRARKAAERELPPAPKDDFLELPPITRRELRVLEGAACKGDTTFTKVYPNGHYTNEDMRHLRRTCASCPVSEECREHWDALESYGAMSGLNIKYVNNFAAGETPSERIARRKEERLAGYAKAS